MMKIKIKLAVFDLDGTLLNHNGELTQQSVKALSLIKAQGVKICIASGRHTYMIQHFKDLIDLTDFIISSNGSTLMSKSFEMIHGHFIHESELTSIVDLLNTCTCSYIVYAYNKIYFKEEGDLIRNKLGKQEELMKKYEIKNCIKIVSLFHEIKNQPIEKIVLYYATNLQVERIQKWISINSINLSLEKTGDSFYSIVNEKSSKGNSVRFLSERLGITSNDIVVFGDYYNDISMFEYAKYRIVPENGIEELKMISTNICGPNSKDGVAKILMEKFV